MSKKDNIKYLKMKIKDILSLNVSSKYSKVNGSKNNCNHNRELIKEIIAQEKLKNEYTITFVLELSLNDYIDIFTYKKEFEDFDNKKYIDLGKINEVFKHCDSLFNEIYDSRIDYFAYFIFFLYNYQRWFAIKKERNIIKKEKSL